VGRIEKFYQRRFGVLLAGAANLDDAIAKLFARARHESAASAEPFSLLLARIHADLVRARGASRHFPTHFVCDAGLGGLARWLRGAGYEAVWKPELDDASVIREAQARAATLLTTDSLMTERGVLRDGVVPCVFLPSTLTCEQQFEIVWFELGLTLRESRCMQCGGALRRVSKEAVAHRIPPKTALWLDEYFVCNECDQLFWRGTHWRAMQERLARLNTAPTTSPPSSHCPSGC
jgi:uncharacterized protein